VKARTRTKPRCFEPTGDVALRATAYTWTCPKCGAEHTGSALTRRVVCPECEHVSSILGTRDDFRPETFGFATD
jgi:ribosomal protein L37AE/L43A